MDHITTYHVIHHRIKSHDNIFYPIISDHMMQYFSYYIISYHIISYHIILYHIISYHIISYNIIWYSIISYHIISYCIISYHIISHHIILYHTLSYHIISYRIILYHIISLWTMIPSMDTISDHSLSFHTIFTFTCIRWISRLFILWMSPD